MLDWSSLKQNHRLLFLAAAATAVGSISVAAAIAWIYKRRKNAEIMSKGARDSSSDSATHSSPVSPTISNGFSPTHRVGRRNYREEEAARFGNSEHAVEKMKMIKDEKAALIAEDLELVADPIQAQSQPCIDGDHQDLDAHVHGARMGARSARAHASDDDSRPPSEPNTRCGVVKTEMVNGGEIGNVATLQMKMRELQIELHRAEPALNWSEEVERSARSDAESSSPHTSPLVGMHGGGGSPQAMTNTQSANLSSSHQGGGRNRGGGYQRSVESPSLASMHSEQSADSGRATGGLASSMSPVDNELFELPPMYEFEIPNTLVGLIIGIKGKTIKELCTRSDVRMIIRPHHTPSRIATHQICTVEGRRDQINKCLQMLRRRFPPSRFPDLNLKPVLPPPVLPPSPVDPLGGPQPTPLSLPESVRCEAVLSAMVDAGHFFLQQPTHPSFASLERLDYYMLGIYSQTVGIPELPKPCDTGLLCVATIQGRWHRAVTVHYYAQHDEVLVRFVDYGGYARLSHADLRQIRTDFMTLPFQATECYLANVMPADGAQWSEEANALFKHYTMPQVIEASVVGYDQRDGTPLVELFTMNDNQQTVRIDELLIEAGLARPIDSVILPPASNMPTHALIDDSHRRARPVLA